MAIQKDDQNRISRDDEAVWAPYYKMRSSARRCSFQELEAFATYMTYGDEDTHRRLLSGDPSLPFRLVEAPSSRRCHQPISLPCTKDQSTVVH